MALIDKAYNTLKNLYQKHDRGFFSPDEYNDGCKYVENKLIRESFNFLNNIKNNAKIGRVQKVDYDKERFYRDIVRKLLKSQTLTYDSINEVFELPEDYSLCQSIYYGNDEIDDLSHEDRFILNIPEVAVDETFPVYFMNSDSVEVLPESIVDSVKMYYYRIPTSPKWTYNVVSGKPVFDADKEDFQDFNLPDSIFDEIIVELAEYFGIQLRQPDATQYMSQKKSEGEQLKRAE